MNALLRPKTLVIPIRYNVAVLSIELIGQPQTIELKISKDKSQILLLADAIERSL